MKFKLYTKTTCPFCHSAQLLLAENNLSYECHSLDDRPQLLTEIKEKHNWRTVPLVFDITDDEKIRVIYQVNKEIEKTLTKCFTKLDFKHYTTILYNKLKEYSKSNSDSIMKLFVNLQKDKFDLFLIKNQNLIAYNSFPQSNVDDFMYYISTLNTILVLVFVLFKSALNIKSPSLFCIRCSKLDVVPLNSITLPTEPAPTVKVL